MLFPPSIQPPYCIWNYLSKVQDSKLFNGCYHILEAGLIISLVVLVGFNWLFTASITSDCLELICCGENFKFFSSVFKFFGGLGMSLNIPASIPHHSVNISNVPTFGGLSTNMLCLSACFGHALHVL